MRRKNKLHPYDRAAIREGRPIDIEGLISSISRQVHMDSELPDWSSDKGKPLEAANRNREWLLDKAQKERFIRSVGILATLDAEKLDTLIEEKRKTQTAIGA